MTRTVRKFFGNVFFLYTNQVLIKVGSFLVALKVIDYLGPTQYGFYSTVLAFASFFGLFTTSSGIDDLVITDLVASGAAKEEKDEIFSTAFFLRICLGVISYLLLALGSYLVGYQWEIQILLLIFGISMLFSFHQRNSLLSSGFIVSERRAIPEAAIFLVTAGVLGLKYVMTETGAPLAFFVGADALLVIGISLVFLLLSMSTGSFSVSVKLVNPARARSLFRRTLPLSISALLVSIFLRVDQVMLSKMLGMKEVGIYSVAVRLVEAFNFIPVLMASLLLPVYTRFRERDDLAGLLRVSFRFSSWMALLLVACLILFGRDLLVFLWGERFLGSLPPMLVLSWSIVFVFMGTMNGAMSVAFGLQKYNLVFITIQSVLNVLLNLLMIPRYGIVGAALSTTMTYGLGFLMMVFFPAMHFIAKQAWREFLPLSLFVALLLYGGKVGVPFFNRWMILLALFVMTALLFLKSMTWVRSVQREGKTS